MSASWPFTPDPPDHPEIPYPYPPTRSVPRREGPVAVPTVDVPSGGAVDQLFARRRVLVSGVLDHAAATQVAAELMALDGRSADDVELVINSEGGPLADVLAILDVMGVMRPTVQTRCIGRAKGTAAVLLACGSGVRRCSAHAIITLRCAADQQVHGRPHQLHSQLEELELVRRQIVVALAARTGRAESALIGQLDDGPLLDPAQARAAGFVDEVDGVKRA